jgi:hypothetical protein
MYEGEYKCGKKHGYGKYVRPEKSCYRGDFVENMIQGEGEYEWRDGRRYKG